MIRKVTLAAACALLMLAGPTSAQAAPVINWGGTGVSCSTIAGVGLATSLPAVRAYNTSRFRDRQRVAIQLSIDQHNGAGWNEVARTAWYYAWAWDNFYAQAWVRSDGQRQLADQDFQWVLGGPGVYRVYIRVWHGTTSRMSWRRTGWKIPVHHGGQDDNGNGIPDYCLMWSV